MPSYNAEEFIERTLTGLKNQTYSNFKVLISDDCSTDQTVPVIQSAIKDDERFRLIKQKSNLGWAENVNYLMKKAVETGEYVFIMPHDDQISPEYIQKLTLALQQNPTAVLAFSDVECTYVSGRTATVKFRHLQGISNRRKRTRKLIRFKGPWWVAYRGIVRSDTVRKIIPLKKNEGRFPEFLLDWIWLIKLSLKGEFIRIPEVLYSKFYREESVSVLWTYNIRNMIHALKHCSRILRRPAVSRSEEIAFQVTIFFTAIERIFIETAKQFAFRILKPMYKNFRKSD